MRERKQFLSLLILIIFLAAGCQPGASSPSGMAVQPTQKPAVFPTSAAVFSTQPPLPTPALTPTTEPGQSTLEAACAPLYFPSNTARPQYHLDVYASIEQHALNVRQTIVYPNTSADTLETIRLVVDPNWKSGAFTLGELKASGETPESYTLSGGYLDLTLSRPLQPGCALAIELKFILMLPNSIGIFGYTNDQTMLTNWFPFIPPYHPDYHWQTNNPGEYGEYLVYPLADFVVRLEFQEKDRTIPVAAPAPALEDGTITTYTLTGARTFSLAFLPHHKRLTQMVGDTALSVYYQKANANTAQAALDIMAKSITTYERLFGPYPFESLTTAEIAMYDGMEYDGIFFMGQDVFDSYDRTQKNTFSLMVAHETSHNWWFSQVGNDQAIEPWLDEALATYCELLYLEDNYPDLVDWWWAYRVTYYDPSGPVDVTIYDYSNYEFYRQSVYLRGVKFIQAVRDRVGDEAFLEFFRQYYLAAQGQVATANLFFETLESVTNLNMDSIRQQFFIY